MILQICATEIDEYNFSVINTVSTQNYILAGIDILNDVTAAELSFQLVNGVGDIVTVDILSNWQYLFSTGGLTLTFADFGVADINGFDYFYDGLYEIIITYTYLGVEYTAATTVGFIKIIKGIVYQQMLKSNWRKELTCNCGCDNYNSTERKWNYFQILEWAAELCLVDYWDTILQSLYKLTGTDYDLVTS